MSDGNNYQRPFLLRQSPKLITHYTQQHYNNTKLTQKNIIHNASLMIRLMGFEQAITQSHH